MSAEITRLVRNMGTYGLGDVLVRFLGFLLLPLFTRFMTPLDYGVYSILAVLMLCVMQVCSLGFGASIGPCYFGDPSQENKERVIWTALAVLAADAAVIGTAITLLAGRLSALCFGTSRYSELVTLAVWSACLGLLVDPLALFLKFEEKARLVATLSVASASVTVLSKVLLVVFARRGVRGYIEAELLARAAALLLFGGQTAQRLRPRFSLAAAGRLLSLGLPLVPAFAFLLILQQANKCVLQAVYGLGTLGVYQVGWNLGMFMSIPVNAFYSAWYPFFMSFMGRREEAGPVFSRVSTYYFMGMGALLSLFFIGARPAVMVMAHRAFHEAYRVVGLVAASEFLRGVFFLLLPPIYFAGDVPCQGVIQALAACIGLTLNLALVPRWGIDGAAAALALGVFSMPALAWLWNRTRGAGYLRIPYETGRLALVSALICAIGAASLVPRNYGLTAEMCLATGLCAALACLMAAAMTGCERRAALAFVQGNFRPAQSQ